MPPLLRAERLSAVPGLIHGFTRRTDADGRLLSFPRDATPAQWEHLGALLDTPNARFSFLSQVHGATALLADRAGNLGEGDGLVTTKRGTFLVIRTADCVPVLFLGQGDDLGAAHAGWRGTAAGIVPQTIAAMPSTPTVAVIGPCISVENYEVGDEVVDAIAAAGVPHERFVRRDLGPRPHVDLRAAVQWQLEHAGVPSIAILPHCTFADDNLHSYRREGRKVGSMASVIGWAR
ncbi:MAG: peptidoglycan editing factor PgeF [Myxococcota bacterium]